MKKFFRWLEGPCSLVNRIAENWRSEIIWFITSALICWAIVCYLLIDIAPGENRWDSLAAFGTVGAAISASVSSLLLLNAYIKEIEERKMSKSIAIEFLSESVRGIQWYVRDVAGGIYHLIDGLKNGDLSKSNGLIFYNGAISAGKQLSLLELPDHLLFGLDRGLIAQIYSINKLVDEWRADCERFVLKDVDDGDLRPSILLISCAGARVNEIAELIDEAPFEKREYINTVELKSLLLILKDMAWVRLAG